MHIYQDIRQYKYLSRSWSICLSLCHCVTLYHNAIRLSGGPACPYKKGKCHKSKRQYKPGNLSGCPANDGSSTRLADWKITEMEHMRFRTTQKQQKYSKNMNKYPHVGKTGVDAVHGSCPQMV